MNLKGTELAWPRRPGAAAGSAGVRGAKAGTEVAEARGGEEAVLGGKILLGMFNGSRKRRRTEMNLRGFWRRRGRARISSKHAY